MRVKEYTSQIYLADSTVIVIPARTVIEIFLSSTPDFALITLARLLVSLQRRILFFSTYTVGTMDIDWDQLQTQAY
jgi:hypothetical protein